MASYDKLLSLSKAYDINLEDFFEGISSNIQNNYDNANVNANVQINFSNESKESELEEIKKTILDLSNMVRDLIEKEKRR